MHTANCLPPGKFGLSKALWSVLIFCALTIGSSAQVFTTLASFNGSNGGDPNAGLVQGNDGNFFGTTYYGGIGIGDTCNGCGTIFKMTPQGALTLLYSFCSQPGCADGALPDATLVQGVDGNFYGEASEGGNSTNCTNGCGTVFKITPQGVLTTLHSFNGTDGAAPSGLIQASDGNFYGTTVGGGTSTNCSSPQFNGCGTVFKITPTGTLTTLHSFNFSDGYAPDAPLLQSANGNFYGTTAAGGVASQNCNFGCGTVFEMTPTGTVTMLHAFLGTDGFSPEAALIQGIDSSFYGMTTLGGSNNCTLGCGTIFKITSLGTLTTLYKFDNGNDGSQPLGPMVQGPDRNFYGTTGFGGANGAGVIFKFTLPGTFTTLYAFCSQPSCADGGNPVYLLQASNGTFYGTTLGGGSSADGVVFSFSGPNPTAVQFVPVAPCRLVDTRQTHDPIQGGTFQFFDVPQLGDCNIPTTAAAYSLNVTVVPQRPLGYLTIWPAGKPQPYVSTMNSLDGRIKANAAIVPAGASGAVSVFASNTTDLVLDIDGYFEPASGQTLQFYALKPCRVLDTRNSNGDLGGPYLPSGQERDFPVLESNCQIPNTAQAYSMNFTVVPYDGESMGYLTVWAQGSPKPVVSTLNNLTATIVANAAIVPAGMDGGIAVYPSGNTQLVADIDGYFAPAGQGGLSLYPAPPCRVIDTRKGNGAFSGELTVDVVDSVCAPPATAQAYVFNATVVPVGSLGYLTLWPDTEDRPEASTLNAIDGAITSNMAIVPNIDGKTDAFAAGTTQLILDISSYFAP